MMVLRWLWRVARPLGCVLALAGLFGPFAAAEGSRTLYPATYPAGSSRASIEMDSYANAVTRYAGVVQRYAFLYVYAQAGEYILTASSGRKSGGDIFLYGPKASAAEFGPAGNETLSALTTPVFTCSTDLTGGGALRGTINTRAAELAGPMPAGAVAATGNNYLPCYYRAPSTGFYAVRFSGNSASGSTVDGQIDPAGGFATTAGATVAAWDVTVRASLTATADLNGRLFTYALVATSGANSRPINFLYYTVTPDGYRYQLDLKGLDPFRFAVYVNAQGFLDTFDNSTLYHDIRGTNQVVDTPAGTPTPRVASQSAQYPLFFSDPAVNSAQADQVLGALGYFAGNPARPIVTNLRFSGGAGSGAAYVQQGGTFNFNVTLPGSYEVVISRDGVDYDPANSANRVLRGTVTASNASTPVAAVWNGKDNAGNDFPVNSNVYKYRVVANVGEVHFPLVDAENNPNGGPIVTKLNGPDSGSTTVFYDDRGYQTKSGDVVGTVNGSLCPAGASAAPTVPVNLLGVDSRTAYRNWASGSNPSSDCAAGAGWGDAKALDLWSYTRSVPQVVPVDIVGPDVQVTQVHQATGLATGAVRAGAQVTYQITVTSAGGPATGVVLTETLPAGATFVSATGTPGGPSGGVLTWNIGALSSDQSVSYTVTVTAPGTAAVEATTPSSQNVLSSVARVTATSSDSNSANNAATVTTAVMHVRLLKQVRNVSRGTALSRSDGSAGNPVLSGKPGETLEYCIDFTNFGGANATSVVLTDGVPLNTQVVGGSLAYTLGGAAQTPPAGALSASGLVLPVGSLASGAGGRACFQVLVN